MKTIFVKLSFISLSLLFLFFLVSSQAEGRAPRVVNCDEGETVQAELDKAQDGDVIEVSGACSEHIVIVNNRITLRGVGGATLNGPDANEHTIQVRGPNTVIRDFSSISGGANVIIVQRGASADIRNNTIEGGASSGILVNQSGYARISNNTIRNNALQGVNVRQSASADILSNTLSTNTLRGVQVSGGAEADVDDNSITNNGSDGIRIRRTSHLRLSEEGGLGVANLIEGNGGRGIRCQTGSSIRSPFAQNFGAGNNLGNFLNQGCDVDGTVE